MSPLNTIIRRAQWGARPARDRDALTNPGGGLAVHYSGADADEQANHGNCDDRVRGIQAFHMDRRGWLDIAYSHLICLHGFIYEGRGFGIRTAANGTNRGNDNYFAVCFLGNDSVGRQDFSPAARLALVRLRREYLRRYSRAKGTIGHRDVVSTECPGDEIYAYIHSPAFKAAVTGPGRLPGPSPKPDEFWAWADWKLSGEDGPRPPLSAEFRQALAAGGWPWQALELWVEGGGR